MLKREWGAESNRKLPHLFIPSKTATLVHEFAVEDLTLSRTATLVPVFVVKDLSLAELSDDDGRSVAWVNEIVSNVIWPENTNVRESTMYILAMPAYERLDGSSGPPWVSEFESRRGRDSCGGQCRYFWGFTQVSPVSPISSH